MKFKPLGQLIKNREKSMLKTLEVKEYLPSEEYKFMRDYLLNLNSQDPKILVGMGRTTLDYNTYYSETTGIQLKDGSIITFNTRGESINITKIIVEPEHRGFGLGKVLMSFFFNAVVNHIKVRGYCPKIILECSGSLNINGEDWGIGMEKQVSFFKKFGFEIARQNQDYTHMVLSKQWVFNLELVANVTEEQFKKFKESLV
jgi:GNAT superfamily N-acetyltransferase